MKIRLFDGSLLKQPSAFLPLAMSLAALTLVLAHWAVFGITHETDEGAAAHTWQILMAAQLPFVGYFMLRWLPQQMRAALNILGLLTLTWLANFVAVFWLTG
jgi:hypothetical protein